MIKLKGKGGGGENPYVVFKGWSAFCEVLVDTLSFKTVNTADYHGYHTDALFTLFVISSARLAGRGKKEKVRKSIGELQIVLTY